MDDEPDIREVLCLLFGELAGWQVSTAQDGEGALECVRDDRPDVIILDAQMPGLDGPSTVRRLRAEVGARDLPVILLTASPELVASRLTGADVQGVISKPFDPFSLVDEVRVLMDRGEVRGW